MAQPAKENILDNYGLPRQRYFDRLTKLSEEKFRKECSQMIWLSAYANNNPKSDFHWQAVACYDECCRRGKPEIYAQEHDRVAKSAV